MTQGQDIEKESPNEVSEMGIKSKNFICKRWGIMMILVKIIMIIFTPEVLF